MVRLELLFLGHGGRKIFQLFFVDIYSVELFRFFSLFNRNGFIVVSNLDGNALVLRTFVDRFDFTLIFITSLVMH